MSEQVQTLYEKHVKIRPRPVRGRFQTLRNVAVMALLFIFHALPFLQWKGRQAVLFDLPARRFYIFDINIWPQDFILLTFVLLGLALLLFFVTALFGRVWCGYACPHTVYTEVFMWLEQRIEGNRSEQLKLTRQPWNVEKISKRFGKYLAWFLVALFAGIGFVGYFTPIRQLYVDFFTLNATGGAYFWTIFYGAFCYMQAGLVREQFCKYICPYGRFQGAMFDKHTLIIAYDEKRGEPRRRLKRKDRENPENLGFCVDCTMCVQVCPTGIDIREGLQLECIACAACIDACDNMMDQINAPRGLIRYTSSSRLEGNETKLLRPKTIGYGIFFSVALALFVFAVVSKNNVDMNILRDRNVLARTISNDRMQNIYTIKVSNKTEETRDYELTVNGLDGLELDGNSTFSIEGGKIFEEVIRVNAPTAAIEGMSSEITFTVSPLDNPNDANSQTTKFLKSIR